MNRTEILPILLLLVLALLIVPSVHAQTTNVTILSSSSHAVLRSDGTAHFTVTATLTFTGFTPPATAFQELAPSNLMGVYVTETPGSIYLPSSGVEVNGTATASPGLCMTWVVKPAYQGYSTCYMAPSSSSGTETVTFNVVIYNAASQQYSFQVNAAMYSTSSLDAPYTYVMGSGNYATFDVGVVSQLTLTVTAPPLVVVTIDGSPQMAGPVTVTESPGVHTISVPQIVQVDNGTRLNFDHWGGGSGAWYAQNTTSLDLEDDTQLTASYVTQYLLTLNDPSATGAGWYVQGSIAQISAPASESCPGILGSIGCTETFQGWYENGVLVSTSNDASITMNASHTLDIQWSTNTITPLIVMIILVVVIGGGLFAFDLHRRRAATPTTPSTTATETVPLTTIEEPKKLGPFCINCGKQLPVGAKFCKECGAKQE